MKSIRIIKYLNKQYLELFKNLFGAENLIFNSKYFHVI